MRRRSWLLVIACALAPATAGGCRGMRFLAYLFAPEDRGKTVYAEYDKLPGSSVAVVIYADDKTQAEHRNIQLDVCWMVSAELRKRVKDVTVVAPRRVVKYQRENLFWGEMDRTKLGRDLEAGYVLYIALEQFSTLEPGSLQLYRGRLSASASVYKTSLPARDAQVWGPTDIRILHPSESASVPPQSESGVRHATIAILADRLVKKFYEHKQKPDP